MPSRFRFDREKSRAVRQKHGVSLKEAQKIFDQAYLVDQKNDDPEEFRAIGCCGIRLCSVIFEIRPDAEGEYYHLITAWRATQEEEQSYAENVQENTHCRRNRGDGVSRRRYFRTFQ